MLHLSRKEAAILSKLVLPELGEVGELDDDGRRAVANLADLEFIGVAYEGASVRMWPTRRGKYRVLNPSRLRRPL